MIVFRADAGQDVQQRRDRSSVGAGYALELRGADVLGVEAREEG